MSLSFESLELREVPSATSAVFSNGTLTVLGDNSGNSINVYADQQGVLHVTERGQQITVVGGVATTANTTLVSEVAGSGRNNTLMTDPTLGSIATSLVGTDGSGLNQFLPGNNALDFASGSQNKHAVNEFRDNPGGKDVFVGGAGANLFYWPPGTGTDVYVGNGKFNEVLVVGNNNQLPEVDSLVADGNGGEVYSRTQLNGKAAGSFNLYATGIDKWDIQPTTGDQTASSVTIGDLGGTGVRQVEVDASNSMINAAPQTDWAKLVVNGTGDTVTSGFDRTKLVNRTVPTDASVDTFLLGKYGHHDRDEDRDCQ